MAFSRNEPKPQAPGSYPKIMYRGLVGLRVLGPEDEDNASQRGFGHKPPVVEPPPPPAPVLTPEERMTDLEESVNRLSERITALEGKKPVPLKPRKELE